MTTRLKTVEYWFPPGTTANDAADTNLTQITVYLPESSKSFKSVFLEVVAHDRNTTVSSISRRQLSLQLAAAGYSAVNNANTLTTGAEQQTFLTSADYTAYFNTNWTGTSMTCDARVLFDSAVASPLTPSFNNISARLVVTYEYDDTSSTHIKTVRIPLNLPVGAMGTSKPASLATIPALDTELPETTKVYRQRTLVLQGNDNGASTDLVFNMQVNTDTAFASGSYEHGSNVAMMIRCNSASQTFDTSVTRDFYAWVVGAANGNHMQAWLVVTYEFDATGSTDVFCSLKLPLSYDGPMGGTTSSDYNRAIAEFYVEEANIVSKQIAAYLFWDQAAAISSLQFRVGTGSFVTYTDAAAVVAGSNAAMVRNDAAYTVARGKNTFVVDNWRSDTADLGWRCSGFLIVNYTGDKPADGYGAANHTVEWNLVNTDTRAAANVLLTSAIGPAIPETDFYINAAGLEACVIASSATAITGYEVQVERLSAEGGVQWLAVIASGAQLDSEVGNFYSYGCICPYILQWPQDVRAGRFNLETNRRYRFTIGNLQVSFYHLTLFFTYHTIKFSISGDVSGSGGGTVTLKGHRVSDGIQIASGSRSGNGSYTLTWYDNTENVFVEAKESSTLLGRTDDGLAA